MDYLRSCYETDMVLQQGAAPVHVRWYFVDPANPVIRTHSFGSLNWIKPDAPTDHIGEVVGASRSWVDGSRPTWLRDNPTHSRTGLLPWYITGAPPDFFVNAGVTFDGKRVFPPGGATAGIFPRFVRQLPVPQLTSSVRGVADEGTVSTSYAWTWSSQPMPFIAIDWGPLTPIDLLKCLPAETAFMQVRSIAFPSRRLRCDSWDTVTGVSVWSDPSGGLGGETFTLQGFPAA